MDRTTEHRIARLRERMSNDAHGIRARYVLGCRCEDCTRANREYNAKRVREVIRTRESGSLVAAGPTRKHILKLRRAGVGYKQVADAARVSISVIRRILYGGSRHCRAATRDRILAVDTSAAADHALVDAGPTWRLLDELIADGYKKSWLAHQFGQKGNPPSLQVGRERVLVATAARVRKLYDALKAGKIRRES